MLVVLRWTGGEEKECRRPLSPEAQETAIVCEATSLSLSALPVAREGCPPPPRRRQSPRIIIIFSLVFHFPFPFPPPQWVPHFSGPWGSSFFSPSAVFHRNCYLECVPCPSFHIVLIFTTNHMYCAPIHSTTIIIITLEPIRLSIGCRRARPPPTTMCPTGVRAC